MHALDVPIAYSLGMQTQTTASLLRWLASATLAELVRALDLPGKDVEFRWLVADEMDRRNDAA